MPGKKACYASAAEKAEEAETSRHGYREHVYSSEQESRDCNAGDQQTVRQTAESPHDTEHEQHDGIDDGDEIEGVAAGVVLLAFGENCFALREYLLRVGVVAVNVVLVAERAYCGLLVVYHPVDYLVGVEVKIVVYEVGDLLSQVVGR